MSRRHHRSSKLAQSDNVESIANPKHLWRGAQSARCLGRERPRIAKRSLLVRLWLLCFAGRSRAATRVGLRLRSDQTNISSPAPTARKFSPPPSHSTPLSHTCHSQQNHHEEAALAHCKSCRPSQQSLQLSHAPAIFCVQTAQSPQPPSAPSSHCPRQRDTSPKPSSWQTYSTRTIILPRLS